MYFVITKVKALTEERIFLLTNKLTLKQRLDLVIIEAGKLDFTFIELVLPNIRNVVYRCVYKHPSMKTKFF